MSKRREANARLYDAALGRFLSPDPYVQAPDFTQNFNRYSYCLNNPLVYVDEDGEFFWIIPNISWSKHGGLSIGISFVFGIPGGASLQAGIRYNFKSKDESTPIIPFFKMLKNYGTPEKFELFF